MLPQADARAYGMTTALRRGFNAHKPRVTTIALTDCLVTRADGTQYIIERNTKSRKASTRKTTTSEVTRKNDYNLMARMSSIHT